MKKLAVKLIGLIEKIPNDKVLHSYGGFVISDIIFKLLFITYLWTSIIAIIVSLAIAILKEHLDVKVKNSTADYKDCIATVGGTLFNILIQAI